MGNVQGCHIPTSVVCRLFNRVDHKLLLHKLERHGLSENLLNWLHDYLNSRSVQVRVDGALSKDIPVTSGVPQGSVLGPILFIVFVNDIPYRILLFADYIKLWVRIRGINDCSRLQLDLNALHLWSIQNKLPSFLKSAKCYSWDGIPFLLPTWTSQA